MTHSTRALLAVVSAAFMACAAEAHHSFSAEFIPDSRGEVTGVVTRVWFTNPHARYRLEVEGDNGATEEWELQLTSVTNLRGANWFADTIKVGDKLTAQGELGRNDAKKL